MYLDLMDIIEVRKPMSHEEAEMVEHDPNLPYCPPKAQGMEIVSLAACIRDRLLTCPTSNEKQLMDLPDEIIEHIFTFLDDIALCQMARVSL